MTLPPSPWLHTLSTPSALQACFKRTRWPTCAWPILWQETRSWLLAAGYTVVAVDVRGTGASFGQWRAPWQPEERADSVQVVDWIVSQPWSNQQVAEPSESPFLMSCGSVALLHWSVLRVQSCAQAGLDKLE